VGVGYEVSCPCGQGVRGERRQRHQVVACPGCGRKVFVLPQSPWPGVREEAPLPRRARLRAWRTPLVAGLLCLALVSAGFLLLLPRLRKPSPEAPQADPRALVLAEMEAGRRALGQGKFHLALRDLNWAVARRDGNPGLLSGAQNRDLNQLQRQADLLARLSTHPLEDVLRQASLVRDPEEWQARFRDHRGKTVVFDDVVGRDGDGRPALSFHEVRINDEVARLALEDLTLLEQLPLDPPRRLLFGARLARVGREAGGGWVVRFAPDSAVLLTDPGAAAACCPLDADLREVLGRQKRWLDELAGLKPAPAD
jgi:hypothetical protein